jgi:hypothetical protein
VTPYAGESRDRSQRAFAGRQLQTALEKIAESQGYHDPKSKAQLVKNQLLRRIDDYRSSRARFQRYDHFVGSERAERERRTRWLYYVTRLTHNKRNIGHRHGLGSHTKSSAIEDAAAVERFEQLRPVEQLAFKYLRGGRRPKKKPKLLEKRAVQLAGAIEAEWFTAPPRKTRQDPNFDKLKPLLTISEAVSMAAPVIEEFAQEKISARNWGSDALFHTIDFCLKRGWIAREASASRDKAISKRRLLEVLSRVRNVKPHESVWKITDN